MRVRGIARAAATTTTASDLAAAPTTAAAPETSAPAETGPARARRHDQESDSCRTARARSARSSSRQDRHPRAANARADQVRRRRQRPIQRGDEADDGVTGAKIAGKDVEIVGYGCADDTADKAIEETRRLMEQEDADIMIGPLSGDEGIAVANYAKEHPDKTFVNGIAGAQDATLKVQAPNFFRFHPDGAQWSAGLGDYAYNELGWKNAAIIGDDYSFPYTSLAGFVAEFCAARRPGHQARVGAAGREGLLVLHLPDPRGRRRPVRRHRRLGPDLVHQAVRGAARPRRHRAHAGQRLLGRPARAQGDRQVARGRRHRGDDGGDSDRPRSRPTSRASRTPTATRSPAPARRSSRTATTPA